MRRAFIPLLLGSGLALGGCLPSIAAGVVGAAVRAATPAEDPGGGPDMRYAARQACSARASQHGSVQIIDAEQGRGGRVTVWGTVHNQQERRAFECAFKGRVTGFTLRAIRSG